MKSQAKPKEAEKIVQTTEAREPRPAALVRASDIIPQELLKQALDNHQSVEVIERLVALAKDVRAQQAREAWFDAISEFQRTAPRIIKSKLADAGNYKFRYAPLDEIMEAIGPGLSGLGLSVSWTHRIEERSVTASCHISHSLGHVESSGDVVMPIPEALQGGRGATAPQRVGMALSYAKRYSLMAIAGIAPKNPDDEEGEEAAPRVEMPRRQGEPATAKADKPKAESEGLVWEGRIVQVNSQATRTGGKCYWIKTEDGEQFSTFDGAIAKFANEAAGSPVRIYWKASGKYKNVVTIEPAIEEPGSDDGPV